MIEKQQESERSQVVTIVQEIGKGGEITMKTIQEHCPWLHPQRISASLYTLYKEGTLSHIGKETREGKGPQRNLYLINDIDTYVKGYTPRRSTTGWTKKTENTEAANIHPEEDNVSPLIKDEIINSLLKAAEMVENNYINESIDPIREAYFKIRATLSGDN